MGSLRMFSSYLQSPPQAEKFSVKCLWCSAPRVWGLPPPKASPPHQKITLGIPLWPLFFWQKNFFFHFFEFSVKISQKIFEIVFNEFSSKKVSKIYFWIHWKKISKILVTPNFQIFFFIYFSIKTSRLIITFELKTIKMKLKNFYKNIFFIFFHQIKK